eukprot:Colp12_sorted_trinity150504_noHs@3290
MEAGSAYADVFDLSELCGSEAFSELNDVEPLLADLSDTSGSSFDDGESASFGVNFMGVFLGTNDMASVTEEDMELKPVRTRHKTLSISNPTDLMEFQFDNFETFDDDAMSVFSGFNSQDTTPASSVPTSPTSTRESNPLEESIKGGEIPHRVQQSDEDEEVDVVSVDAPTLPLLPETVVAPVKRKSEEAEREAKRPKLEVPRPMSSFEVQSSMLPSVSDSIPVTPSTHMPMSPMSDSFLSELAEGLENANHDTLKKRHMHNIQERRRREDLKVNFAQLRRVIPDLEDDEKIAKVLILKRATQYVQSLIEKEVALDFEHSQLELEHIALQNKLAEMKSRAASRPIKSEAQSSIDNAGWMHSVLAVQAN